MSRKKTYGAIRIKSLDVPQLLAAVTGAVVVAVDVAKAVFAAAVMLMSGEVLQIVRFDHPTETRAFLALLEHLRDKAIKVTVVMEPTGTYGDALRHQLHARQIAVSMVQPKRTHDAKEVFDGVPSAHDNKDAVMLGRLHLIGASTEWRASDDVRRSLRAYFDQHAVHESAAESAFGQIEARLARHWPELQRWLSVREQTSTRALLKGFGSPQAVASEPDRARELLRQASRGQLSTELIEGTIESARTTLGVPMVDAEVAMMKAHLTFLCAQLEACDAYEREIDEAMHEDAQYLAMRSVVGPMAAAAIRTYLQPVSSYKSARAYLKAAGLNVREESSGTEKGQIHITKRGPSIVRKQLYMAALRAIQRNPIASAWYRARRSFTQDRKTAAIVALMRKLMKGLYGMCKQNAPFNSAMLFDTRRLEINATATSTKPKRPTRRTEPRSIARGRSRRERCTEQGGASA